MDAISERIARLSPEKRRVLEELLRVSTTHGHEVSIPRKPSDAPSILSSAQLRMWVLSCSEGETAGYNIPVAVRFQGPLNADALEDALNWVVSRHEVLRTAFSEQGGHPLAVVTPELRVHIEHVEGEGPQEIKLHVERITASRMDLGRAPIMRPVLFRCGTDEHVFVVVFHHLIFDGWSVGLFLAELRRGYEALVEGRRPEAPPLPLQYLDYAHWEASTLQEANLEKLLDYWTRRLEGAPAQMFFPSCHDGDAANQSTGSLEFEVERDVYCEVETFSKSKGFTPFIVLLAALKAVLARLCVSEDIVVGVQNANRGAAELEGLIGLFVNAIVLRTDLSGRPTFLELCHRVRETVSGAFTHQALPFERLVQALKVRTEGARHPLFNVVFNFRNQSMESERFGNVLLVPLPDGGPKDFAPKFDLVFHLVDTGRKFGGAIEYAPHMFSEGLVKSLRSAFRHLLRQGMHHPDAPIAGASLAEPFLGEVIVRDWNRTGTPSHRDRCAHEIFEATCDRSPDALAIEFEGEKVAYAELDRRANRLARRLQREGLGPERLAACYFDRSPDLLVAILAIWKAGGAFSVLDPRYRSERHARILRSASPSIVLTTGELAPDLPPEGGVRLCVDREAGAIASESAGRLGATAVPDNLAYVIFTSGSTGEPKGVMCHHRGLANLADAQLQVFGMSAEDRILQFSSVTFDAFVWELLMAWSSGAMIRMARWDTMIPGPGMTELLEGARITALTIPPSALAALPAADLPDLRTLIVAGEAAPAGLTRAWAAGRRMVNAYGPTETTVWATFSECEAGRAPAIGRPISNLRAYVLDEHMHPVPPGFRGEIHIGGPGLARGYLDRADLTAERFIPDPFSDESGARLYRTGDLGSYLPDGQIYFEGREDDQVKIRGFRVEPGEIQKMLEQHPCVGQVYVAPVERAPDQLQLAAWFTATGDWTEAELRRWADKHLPSYMRPSAYICLEQMPLTAHGKIDRRRLPEPDWSQAVSRFSEGGQPRGSVEEKLAEIWASVLKLETVAREDNFFELGGDSILAIQIVSRANQAGIPLKARDVFQHQTIAEVAEVVSTATVQRVPRAVRRAAPWYPLSPLQEGLLYHVLRSPEAPLYVQQFSMQIRGDLDRQALERAWQDVLDRHSALRTSFGWEASGAPRQAVHPPMPVPFHFEDWCGLSGEEQRSRWREHQERHLRIGLPLDRPPLVRCSLFKVENRLHYFLWETHHIVVDGWSFSVISREVFQLYRSHSAGVSALLPQPGQFADYLEWLRQRGKEQAEAYWSDALEGFTAPTLIADFPSGALPIGHVEAMAQEEVSIADADVAALQGFCRQNRLTLNTLFQAAWAFVLGRYTGHEDVVYGVTVSGRPPELPGVENIVGLFVNTLPFRVRLPKTAVLGDWLRDTHRRLQDLQQHSFSYLVDVQRHSNVPAGQPLFDNLLAFQSYPTVDSEAPEGIDIQQDPALERTDYPLTIMAEPGSPFRLRMIYDRRSVSDYRARQLVKHLRNTVLSIPAAVSLPLAQWSLLDHAEHQRIVHDWNHTATAFSGDLLIHQYIARQAAEAPAETALVFEETEVTYGELNARANQLAHWLRSRDVGPESVIAVHGERSPELIIAIVAILKAGGAFLPLSTEHPPARIKRVLESAHPLLILTQQSLRHRLPDVGVEVVGLDVIGDSIHTSDPLPQASGSNLAYVIYTSGSTGEPKGVMNTHGGILNRILWGQREHPIGRGDRVLQKTPITFDVSVWEMLWPLATGACLVIAAPGMHMDSSYLTATIARRRVTVLHLVPSMLQLFLEDGDVATRCRSVRLVICSGEALTVSQRERFFSSMSARLLNLYGPAEAAVEVTQWLCRKGETDSPVPIGTPISNTRMYVLDMAGAPCPPGVAGELHIAGIGLARGYLGRPDLTAERFIPDPFCRVTGQLMYRTGDLARYRPDGAIEYLNRLDFQLKIRGQRIELGEIEETLRSKPGIRDAVAVAMTNNSDGPRIVAYVVGQGVHAPELREYLAERLPDSMIPSSFVPLDAIPLTASGKIDRRALPSPQSLEPSQAAGRYLPPRDSLETELAQMWAEVLDAGRVGIRDHFFFDLGGHSLLALRLLSRMKRRWPDAAVQLPDFLQDPTVEGIARLLPWSEAGTGGSVLMPIQRAGTQTPLFIAPPAMGVALVYYELARALGADQPVYAFQAAGLSDNGETIADVVGVARRYIEAMRTIQPSGPYRLAGYSYGGVVAFDMARQLLGAGEVIDALFIIDTPAPAGDAGPAEIDEPRLVAELASVLARYYRSESSITAEDLRTLDRDARFELVRRHLAERGILHTDDAIGLENLIDVQRAAIESLAAYRPAPYTGPVQLIRSSHPTAEDMATLTREQFQEETFGWQRWCASPVQVRWIAADHISLMQKPGVLEVATLVNAAPAATASVL